MATRSKSADAKQVLGQQQPSEAKSPLKSSPNKSKPSYKHVPHSQKPPHLVAKRNLRERRRVQAVNQAFYKLRKCVPIENRNKRVSKVKTLQRAIDYIRKLERILAEDDQQQAEAEALLYNANQQPVVGSSGCGSSQSNLQVTSTEHPAGVRERSSRKQASCDREAEESGVLGNAGVGVRQRRPRNGPQNANKHFQSDVCSISSSTPGAQAAHEQPAGSLELEQQQPVGGGAHSMSFAGQPELYQPLYAGYAQPQPAGAESVLRESSAAYNNIQHQYGLYAPAEHYSPASHYGLPGELESPAHLHQANGYQAPGSALEETYNSSGYASSFYNTSASHLNYLELQQHSYAPACLQAQPGSGAGDIWPQAKPAAESSSFLESPASSSRSSSSSGPLQAPGTSGPASNQILQSLPQNQSPANSSSCAGRASLTPAATVVCRQLPLKRSQGAQVGAANEQQVTGVGVGVAVSGGANHFAYRDHHQVAAGTRANNLSPQSRAGYLEQQSAGLKASCRLEPAGEELCARQTRHLLTGPNNPLYQEASLSLNRHSFSNHSSSPNSNTHLSSLKLAAGPQS